MSTRFETKCPHCEMTNCCSMSYLYNGTYICARCGGYFHTVLCPVCRKRVSHRGFRKTRIDDCCGYRLEYLFCRPCNLWRHYWADGAKSVVFRCACGGDVGGRGRAPVPGADNAETVVVGPFAPEPRISDPGPGPARTLGMMFWGTFYVILFVSMVIRCGIQATMIFNGFIVAPVVVGLWMMAKSDPSAPSAPSAPSVPLAPSDKPVLSAQQAQGTPTGTVIDARNGSGKWYRSRVKRGVGNGDSLLISFIGWGDRYDEEIPVGGGRLAPAGTFTRAPVPTPAPVPIWPW